MTTDRTRHRRLLRSPWGWLATGFGSGLSPRAPGTIGTVPAVAVFPWLYPLGPWGYLLAVALLFVLGVYAAQRAITLLGREDPPEVVIDEWVGAWITLGPAAFLRPELLAEPVATALYLGLGFVLFRLCDILKPWPANRLDARLGGGFGAMADDAVAGLWAALALLLLIQPLPRP
jgi:phosphatidylglycerophosphatase A